MSERSECLKHDHFGAIYRVERDAQCLIRRDTRAARRGVRWFARWVAGHEARALRALEGIAGVPRLLAFDGVVLERSYIAGAAMHDARPTHLAYYRAARRLVLALHRRGVAHNDLAKEANWLVTERGEPAVVDFQMGWVSKQRGRFFRMLAHEDLRHLLKHKRTYCPQALTPIERRVLARRSWLSRVWQATGKRVYVFVTRRLLHWQDREGQGAPRA